MGNLYPIDGVMSILSGIALTEEWCSDEEEFCWSLFPYGILCKVLLCTEITKLRDY